MKNLLIIFCSVGLIFSCATPPEVLPYAAANYSTVVGDQADSFESKIGFAGGLGFQFGLCENWNLQPELMYSSQGADYSDSDFTGTYSLNYLNVPIMAQFEVGDGFHLEAGPQIGFLLSAKDEYSLSDGGSMEEDIKEFVKSTDFGLNLGAGYTFSNGISLRARYNLGLTDVIDNQELSDAGAKWKNSVVSLAVGYYIKLGDIKGESKD